MFGGIDLNGKIMLLLLLTFLISILYVKAMTIDLKAPGNFSYNANRNINFSFNATWSFSGTDPSSHENVSNCSLWVNSTNPAIKWDIAKNISVDSIGEDNQLLNGSAGFSYMNFTYISDGNYTYAISCLNFTNSSISPRVTFSYNSSFLIDTIPPTIDITINNTSPKVNDTINISANNITDTTPLLSANITYNMSDVLVKINFTSFELIYNATAIVTHIHSIITITDKAEAEINITVYATDSSNNVGQNSKLIKVARPPPISASQAFGDPQSFITADSYVDKGSPNTNLGRNESIWVVVSTALETRGYWLLNFSNVTGTISEANFVCKVDRQGGATSKIEAYWTNGTFSQSIITWNNQPCGTIESYTDLPCNQTLLDSNSVNNERFGNLTFDISEPVKIAYKQASYDKHLILLIRHKLETTINQDTIFFSKEDPAPEEKCGLYMVVAGPPTITSANLTNTDFLNRTNGTLIASWSYSIPSGNNIIANETFWYINNTKVEVYTNKTSLHPNNTTRFENWTFSVRVFDGVEWSNFVNSSTIKISNAKPIINTTPITIAKESELYTYKVNAIDIDNDILSFSDNTSLFDINSTSGLISFVPSASGDYPIKIIVSDGFDSSNQIYNLSIKFTSKLSITVNSPKNNSVINEKTTILSISTDTHARCNYSIDSTIFKDFSSISGDFWQVKTPTKRLELSEDLALGGPNRELLSNITTFISRSNLNILDFGSVSNNKGSSNFNQFLYLLGPSSQKNMDSGYVVFIENDEDVTSDFLFFKSGREIGRYLLEFVTAFQSDIKDNSGSLDPNDLYLPDFENVEIKLFGKPHKIVYARRLNNSPSIRLDLIVNAIGDTLLEKQTKSYSIGGKSYNATLNFLDSDEAQFIVNGVKTNKLVKDQSQVVSELLVYVKEVHYQDYAGGIHWADFYLGTQKIELSDSNVTDSSSSNALKVNDNTIDDAYVMIEGGIINNTFNINRIHVNMTADDNFYVTAGKKLSDAIKDEGGSSAEPEVLFTNQWDITYRGLANETLEIVKIVTSGTSQYNLQFLDGDSKKVSVPVANAPNGSSLIFGEQAGRAFINKENRTINKDDYFVISNLTDKRGERQTYVLQYKGADKINNTLPVIRFKNLGSVITIAQNYTSASSLEFTGPMGNVGKLASLKVGNYYFNVYNASSIQSNDFGILIDLDGNGIIQNPLSAPVVITTKHGMEINITNETNSLEDTSDIIFVKFLIPDESRDGNSRDSVQDLLPTPVRLNITAASGKVQFNFDTTTEKNRLLFRTPSGSTNISYAYDSYGDFYTYETSAINPSLLTVKVPSKQREALVYYDNGKLGEHSTTLSNLTPGKHNLQINCTDTFNGVASVNINFNVSVPFYLVSQYPTDGKLNVSTDTNITFTLNKNLDISTLKPESFTFEDSNGIRVKFLIYYDSAKNKTTLDPLHLLLPDQTYHFSFKESNPIKDLDGNQLPFSTIVFRTAAQDTDNDGKPDWEDDDLDNDGINDSVDFLKGDLNNINSNFLNLTMKIDFSDNLSKVFNGTKKIEFLKGDRKLLFFDFAFDNSTKLDLSNISILNASNSSLGGAIIRGIGLSKLSLKKTISVDKLNDSMNGICVKDEEIDWIDNISPSCSLSNEFKVECDGTSQNGYICIYNSTTNSYQVSGLSHSGAVQLSYTKPSDSGGSSGGSSGGGGGSSGGGGGGGGGGAFFVCNQDWQCGEWSTCINGIQTRQCEFVKVPQHASEKECSSQHKPPITSQKCAVVQKEEKKEITEGVKQTFNKEQLNKSKNEITGLAVKEVKEKTNVPTIIISVSIILIIGIFFYFKLKK